MPRWIGVSAVFLILSVLHPGVHAATLNISTTLQGKSTPLPCRVHLENCAGETILPDMYPNFKTHFTCEGTATLSLPPGAYTYAIEKGPEFTRSSGMVTIKADAPVTVAATLERITNMAAEGWWSGDLHVHRPPEHIELLMHAEDLHIAPVITWWNKKNLWQDKPLPADPLVRFDENRYYHLMAGEDERDGGAFNFFGLDSPVDITAGERFYPCQVHYIPEARRRGAWVELEKPYWWDGPIGIGLGFVDSIGIANNHMWRHGMLDNEAWGRPRLHETSPAAHANGTWTQEIYYHVLNAGLRIPPSAGSASGVIPNPIGYNRVYVQLDGPLDYDAWWEGLRDGRSFVTNGPLLRVKANGELPGHVFKTENSAPLSITLTGILDSNDSVSTIQIVKNGRVIQEVPTAQFTDNAVAKTITFAESGWFLVRAIADVDHTFRFASTAPYYVEIGDTPRIVRRESVAFFLDWIDERNARIDMPEEQRRDIMEHHDKARAFWEGLLENAVD